MSNDFNYTSSHLNYYTSELRNLHYPRQLPYYIEMFHSNEDIQLFDIQSLVDFAYLLFEIDYNEDYRTLRDGAEGNIYGKHICLEKGESWESERESGLFDMKLLYRKIEGFCDKRGVSSGVRLFCHLTALGILMDKSKNYSPPKDYVITKPYIEMRVRDYERFIHGFVASIASNEDIKILEYFNLEIKENLNHHVSHQQITKPPKLTFGLAVYLVLTSSGIFLRKSKRGRKLPGGLYDKDLFVKICEIIQHSPGNINEEKLRDNLIRLKTLNNAAVDIACNNFKYIFNSVEKVSVPFLGDTMESYLKTFFGLYEYRSKPTIPRDNDYLKDFEKYYFPELMDEFEEMISTPGKYLYFQPYS